MAVAQTLSRIEARVDPSLYEMIKEAARIEGLSVSAFIVSAAKGAAEAKLEKYRFLKLAAEDQRVLAEALLRGPQPHTPAFEEAEALHKKLVR